METKKVAIHELVESSLAKKNKVSFTEINNFDKANIKSSEPGELINAPYHKEHLIANEAEKLFNQVTDNKFLNNRFKKIIEVNNPKINSKLLNAEISAYTASPEETDTRPRETSTQTEVQEGKTIGTNNPKLLGKKVKIQGVTYTVEDLMNERYRKEFLKTGKLMFDIFKEDKKEALKFGRQQLPVELLD